MYCPNCGAKIEDDAKFCKNCGFSIKMYKEDSQKADSYTKAVLLAKAGDNDGLTYLYEQTYKSKYYLALKYMGTKEAAEDVLQDAYIKAFSNLDSLSDPETFPTWFGTIVANTAKDALKKKNPVLFSDMNTGDEDVDEQELQIPDEDLSTQPEIAYTKQETSEMVQDMLGCLSEEQRMCILMYYIDGESVKDIASALGCSENTVKSRLNYGRKNLRAEADEMEKKGYKLYGLAPLPLLLLLLRLESGFVEASGEVATDMVAMEGTVLSAGAKVAAQTSAKVISDSATETTGSTGNISGKSPEETGNSAVTESSESINRTVTSDPSTEGHKAADKARNISTNSASGSRRPDSDYNDGTKEDLSNRSTKKKFKETETNEQKFNNHTETNEQKFNNHTETKNGKHIYNTQGGKSMYCKNCGAKLEEGQKFCKECGTPVEGGTTEQRDKSEQHITPEQSKGTSGSGVMPPKKRNSRMIAGIIAAIVAAAAVVTVVVVVNRSDIATEQVAENEQNEESTEQIDTEEEDPQKIWVPKTMTRYYWDDEGDKLVSLYDEWEYDENFSSYKKTSYNEDGSIIAWDEGTIDKNGNTLEEVWYMVSDWAPEGYYAVSEKEYTYNENGDILTYYENWVDEPDHYAESEYTYDENGYLLSQSYLYFEDLDAPYTDRYGEYNDHYTYTYEYTYNEEGQVSSRTRYNEAGGIDASFRCIYSEEGNELTGNWYDEEGEKVASTTSTYDDNGNLLSYYSDEYGYPLSWEYTYVSY